MLRPGGIREPHWHPSAWEVNYVISGEARWSDDIGIVAALNALPRDVLASVFNAAPGTFDSLPPLM